MDAAHLRELEEHLESRPEQPGLAAAELAEHESRRAFAEGLQGWRPLSEVEQALQAAHPGLALTDLALRVVYDLLRDVLARLADESLRVASKALAEVPNDGDGQRNDDDDGRSAPEVTPEAVETAVRLVFAGEVAKHGVLEARRAAGSSGGSGGLVSAGSLRALLASHPRARQHAWTAPACAAAAGAVEYLLREVLELAGNARRDDRATRPLEAVAPRHLMLAVRSDEELSTTLAEAVFPEAGVVPYVHSRLLPRRDDPDGSCSSSPSSGERAEQKSAGGDSDDEEDEDDDDGEAQTDADVMAEIEALQGHGRPLLPAEGFAEFAAGVMQAVPEAQGFTLSDDALAALRAASEEYAVEALRASQLCAIHAKRVKVFPKDLRLQQRLLWCADSNTALDDIAAGGSSSDEGDDDEGDGEGPADESSGNESKSSEEHRTLCIPRASFKRLVEEIVQDMGPQCKRQRVAASGSSAAPQEGGEGESDGEAEDEELIEDGAVDALHAAAEEALTRMMVAANAAAVHTGRMSIMPKDICLYRRLSHQSSFF
eukprot:m51a1_g10209 putative histone h2a (544) ;mRNA; r:80889-82630